MRRRKGVFRILNKDAETFKDMLMGEVPKGVGCLLVGPGFEFTVVRGRSGLVKRWLIMAAKGLE